MKPLGFNVLIEMEVVETKTSGGIILPSDLTDKEQAVTCIGWIRAIGPTAWAGYPGCEDDMSVRPSKRKTPAECWGVKVGDKVEYEKYAGLRSVNDGYENYRTIPDSKIINLIEEA